jgi:hypothetical protein
VPLLGYEPREGYKAGAQVGIASRATIFEGP